MKIRKVLALLLVMVMMAVAMPLASIAEEIQLSMMYRKMWNDTDAIWAEIEATEAQMEAAGASKESILKALFDIAAAGEGIVSCEWDDEDTFNFVHESGMINAYDWKVKNSETAIANPTHEADKVITTLDTKDSARDLDILLFGPYYGYDYSFTDQYTEEAQSMAQYTGGDYTIYSGHNVDADALREAEDYGIIIFDSHGSCTGGRSYLCLTTNAGFTNEDYAQNRALRSGSEAWVTGAFWEYYCPNMKASMVWMAICEGMMTNTLAVPLMNAGCAVVYGYSQSVTFVGDYRYEETFWNEMKQGATVAEAFEIMVDRHGVNDTYGNPPAYPIVVSELDNYPSNPDSPQQVYCEWHMPTAYDLVVTDPVSVEFAQDSYGVAPLFNVQLEAVVNPVGANNFRKEWTTSDPSIATVDKKGVVTGLREGTAEITYTLTSTEDSNSEYELSATTTVTVSNSYLPLDTLYVPTTTIIPGEEYLIVASAGNRHYAMTNEYYSTSNNRNLLPTMVTVTEIDGVSAIVEGVDAGEGWIFSDENGGTIVNAESGKYLTLNSNYLGLEDQGIEWTWDPAEGADNGVLSNDTNANFKYLGLNSSSTYFGVFIASYNIQLFRKLVRTDGPTPPAGVPGDANGDGQIATDDAIVILRHSLGVALLPDDMIAICDVDGNGDVTSADAVLVLRAALGSIEL